MTNQTTRCVVDDLIEQLPRLGQALIGCGPKHRVAPRSELQEQVEEFLAQYPFLHNDAGYVYFLETYAGASVQSESAGLIIDLFGFDWDIGQHLRDGDTEEVTEDGYLTVATTQVPRRGFVADTAKPSHEVDRYVDMAWSFDAGQTRTTGVYRHKDREPTQWFCPDFETLLRFLITHEGHLEDVPPQSETVSVCGSAGSVVIGELHE